MKDSVQRSQERDCSNFFERLFPIQNIINNLLELVDVMSFVCVESNHNATKHERSAPPGAAAPSNE